MKENEIPRFKACLVAKGYSQKETVDYDENFPIVKHTSIRVLLPLVAQFDVELEQLDVIKTAFLHGDLEETIYIEQPEGIREVRKEDCELKKSLKRLK